MFAKLLHAAFLGLGMLTLAFAMPAGAEDIPKMEQKQLQGSGPDVDASASRGTDASIVKQESEQLQGSGPDTDAGASRGADQPIVSQEKKQMQ